MFHQICNNNFRVLYFREQYFSKDYSHFNDIFNAENAENTAGVYFYVVKETVAIILSHENKMVFVEARKKHKVFNVWESDIE